jgi:flagellar biosynthesis protein FlhG
MVITQNREAKIIPIAGGKGGVGKTELCANLGVRLGQLGYRTIVIDLDLGGSNLHSTLGIKNKNSGLGNFLSDRALGFNDIIYGTPYPNLDFVPGDVLVANTPNVTFARSGASSGISNGSMRTISCSTSVPGPTTTWWISSWPRIRESSSPPPT